jgi:hypothetical protein
MDSSRNNSTQTNSYNSYLDYSGNYSGNDEDSDSRKGSKNDDDDMIAPPEPSISASSLRPSVSRCCVASPYINAYQLLNMDAHNDDVNNDRDHRETDILGNGDGKHRNNLEPAAESPLTRSSIPSSSTPAFGRMPTAGTKATILNSVSSSTSSSIYGTKNTKRSLEDDDPSDSAANIMDHLTISSSLASTHLSTRSPERKMISRIGEIAWSPGMKDDRKINSNIDNAEQFFPPGKASNLYPRLNHLSFENASTEPDLNFSLDHTKSTKSKPSAVGWQQPHSSSHSPLSATVASAHAQAPGEREREWTKSNENNPIRIARPKNDEDYNYDDEHIEHGKCNTIINDNSRHINKLNGNWNGDDNNIRPTAHSAASTNQDDFIPLAKEHTRALMSALMPSVVSSRSEAIETNTSYIRELMECCKKNQETLKENISKLLEEEDAVATCHLMELVSISDEICAAIQAGEDALEREKERTKKKKIAEGPTIELLEENRDVFSLICMLRAPSEKRMQAAMALMKFAKEDQLLRDEIISSGGIHSFLTLFQQTRGITRELKVVSSLAVAHILPSYVASSQTTSSIGLKLVECLHFLAASKPVSPNGIVITIEEMCKAASVGVNVLWINSIQPLIAMKKMKEECTSSPPSLRPGKTVRYGRLRSRTG